MTTLDALILLLLIEALLAVAWAQACKARRLGAKPPQRLTDAKDDGPSGPLLNNEK